MLSRVLKECSQLEFNVAEMFLKQNVQDTSENLYSTECHFVNWLT